MKDNCLYETGTNRKGAYERLLCNFVPWIESGVASCDGTQTTNCARLRGIHKSGRTLPEVEIPSETVESLA